MDTTEDRPAKEAAPGEAETAARAQRIKSVVWLTGVTAVVALMVLNDGASLGMGIGVVGVAAMVAAVSFMILREK